MMVMLTDGLCGIHSPETPRLIKISILKNIRQIVQHECNAVTDVAPYSSQRAAEI